METLNLPLPGGHVGLLFDRALATGIPFGTVALSVGLGAPRSVRPEVFQTFKVRPFPNSPSQGHGRRKEKSS